MSQIYVISTLYIAGIHKWTNCDLPEVEYLKNPHRHVFHIKAYKPVEHGNREVEIILFKKSIHDFLTDNFKTTEDGSLDFSDLSCEQIARRILEKLDCEMVEVLEDGENGAIVSK